MKEMVDLVTNGTSLMILLDRPAFRVFSVWICKGCKIILFLKHSSDEI